MVVLGLWGDGLCWDGGVMVMMKLKREGCQDGCVEIGVWVQMAVQGVVVVVVVFSQDRDEYVFSLTRKHISLSPFLIYFS